MHDLEHRTHICNIKNVPFVKDLDSILLFILAMIKWTMVVRSKQDPVFSLHCSSLPC